MSRTQYYGVVLGMTRLQPLVARWKKIAPATRDWSSYWEALDDRHPIFQMDAVDYVRRLEVMLPLNLTARVLDFGCGFGFVATALAPKVGEIFLWDASSNMRSRAQRRVAHYQNIRFLDLSEAVRLPPSLFFDLIFVNSVAQYMTDEEFSSWLKRWQQMLAPDGRLVISDLIVPGHSALVEMGALLAFSARHQFLRQAVVYGLLESKHYWSHRATYPLRAVARNDLRRQTEAMGLVIEFLPANLTFRTRRYTAVLTQALAVAC
jgi:SAM-dependent methyltransferase